MDRKAICVVSLLLIDVLMACLPVSLETVRFFSLKGLGPSVTKYFSYCSCSEEGCDG